MNNLKKTRRELVEEALSLREALRSQEDRDKGLAFESTMITSAMDAILVVDEAQNIVQFNSAAEQVFGYTASD
jgi:PAS domain-containing protein